jgi:hypothetical protein
MKKQIARTLLMWGLYALTLWVGFGWFGLPTGFMPMFMNFIGTSVFLGFALWETFILFGLNELRKDARDAEQEAETREFFAPLLTTSSSLSLPADNGFQFEIWWNGAIYMWQAELWDITTVPASVCDRDVFLTHGEALDWYLATSKVLDKF